MYREFQTDEEALAFIESQPFPQTIKFCRVRVEIGTNPVKNMDQARAVIKFKGENVEKIIIEAGEQK